MLLAVLFGLHLRVLAKDPCEILSLMHQADHSDHHHEGNLPCDPSHNEKCPSEHHHHCGALCHLMPLVSENDFVCRLPLPVSSRLRVIPESDLIPDGPYLSSDRPPII
jgi:hypothetical protein